MSSEDMLREAREAREALRGDESPEATGETPSSPIEDDIEHVADTQPPEPRDRNTLRDYSGGGAASAPSPPGAWDYLSEPRQSVAAGGETPRRYVGMGLTRALTGFYIVAAVLAGIGALADLNVVRAVSEFEALATPTLSDFDDVIAVVDLSDGANGLAGIAYIVALVLLIIWFNLAFKAAVSRGATGTRRGSGWAIGGWFVPFGNLWIPKQIMDEIDRIATDESDEPIGWGWHTNPRSAVSNWWWAAFVVSGALAYLYVVIPEAEVVSDLTALAFGSAASNVAILAEGVLGSMLILKIGRRLSDPRRGV